jgi:hypothetical protein
LPRLLSRGLQCLLQPALAKLLMNVAKANSEASFYPSLKSDGN